MPSPFPGMDPYLEGDLWTPFHTELGVVVAHLLNPQLVPRYVARTEKRYVMEYPEDWSVEVAEMLPDVAIRKAGKGKTRAVAPAASPGSVEIATIMPRKVPQVRVAIRDTSKRRLVTAIEFLSPTNKIGQGRKSYLRKRAKILRSPVHLLEIDLNRMGQRLPAKKELPPAPYYVFLSRARRRPMMNVWPIQFDQPLPAFPVPLLSPDPDISLNLQEAFEQVYDRGHYELEIEYSKAPEVPLPASAKSWVDKLLRTAGKRR